MKCFEKANELINSTDTVGMEAYTDLDTYRRLLVKEIIKISIVDIDVSGSATSNLANDIKLDKTRYLINLASNEYSKSLNLKQLGVHIITPIFKDFKNGKLKVISFFAKKARGNMCRYIIKNKINSYKKLIDFSKEGYAFDKELSSNSEFVFVR